MILSRTRDKNSWLNSIVFQISWKIILSILSKWDVVENLFAQLFQAGTELIKKNLGNLFLNIAIGTNLIECAALSFV